MNNIYIFGTGGFAAEVHALIQTSYVNKYTVKAFIDLKEGEFRGKPVKTIDYLIDSDDEYPRAAIAIGSPVLRKKIYESLPTDRGIFFPDLIDQSAKILSPNDVSFGIGAIVCANVVVTTKTFFGKFAQLNLGTTVGHDCAIGDYFTTAPLVSISGNNRIKDNVYFGTHACSIEDIDICKNVTIGANACVVKNITTPGTYVGTPAKLLQLKELNG